MTHDRRTPVYVGPFERTEVLRALTRSGGRPSAPDKADIVVWLDGKDRQGLRSVLQERTSWVQLPSAGVEGWMDLVGSEVAAGIEFCSARGAFSRPVAEHALALLLACDRSLVTHARARSWQPKLEDAALGGLADARVLIVGCGGIGEALLSMLRPLGARTTAVTLSGRRVSQADDSISFAELDQHWSYATYVVLAAPLTRETRHLVNTSSLKRMRSDACVINVGRGELIATTDLLEALGEGLIRGAALDVTDPEPLPVGHPLWEHPRVLITSHSANPLAKYWSHLAERVGENLTRHRSGQPLLGAVDAVRGY